MQFRVGSISLLPTKTDGDSFQEKPNYLVSFLCCIFRIDLLSKLYLSLILVLEWVHYLYSVFSFLLTQKYFFIVLLFPWHKSTFSLTQKYFFIDTKVLFLLTQMSFYHWHKSTFSLTQKYFFIVTKVLYYCHKRTFLLT